VSSAEQVPGPTSVGGDGCSGTDRCTRAAATQGGSGWHEAARRARLLSWISLGYMAAEGLVALVAAVVAGSVALLGFGLDSVIEGLASVIVIWRFTGTRTLSPTAESAPKKPSLSRFFCLHPTSPMTLSPP
jgi:hypothetical protein